MVNLKSSDISFIDTGTVNNVKTITIAPTTAPTDLTAWYSTTSNAFKDLTWDAAQNKYVVTTGTYRTQLELR